MNCAEQGLMLLALSAVDLILSGLLLVPRLPPPLTASQALVWLLGVVLLESVSQPLPHLGRFQTVTIWTLGWLGQAPESAALCLLGWCLARTLWGGVTGPSSWAAALAEWSACLVWLPIYRVGQSLGPLTAWLLAATLYLMVQTLLLSRLARWRLGTTYPHWWRVYRLLGPMQALVLCAGIGFLLLPPEFVAARLLLLPTLFGVHLGAQNLLEVVRAQEAAREVAQAEDRLRAALAAREQARQELTATAEESLWLERLASQDSLAGLGPSLSGLLHTRLQLSSLGLFWSRDGTYDSLELLHGQSPHLTTMQNFRLLGWGERTLVQALNDQVARVLQPGWLASEPQALLVPAGQALLYLGRGNATWSEAELAWLSGVLTRCRPLFQSLGLRHRQQEALVEVQHQARSLLARVEGQRCLLECAQRLAVHLKAQDLWSEFRQFLAGFIPLQALALKGDSLPSWGQPLDLSALGPGGAYLAAAARPRWPVNPGAVDNLVVLPFPEGQLLALGFSGQESLQASELELLQGLGHLLATALVRAHLHRRLEESQELWLQTHKSLAMAQMSAGVAHELNSPLGAIRLSLESMQTGADERTQRRLQNALESCHRAQQIINRLGQLSAGPDTQGSTDLVQVCRQLLEQLSPQLGSATVNLVGPVHRVCPYSRALLENLLLPLLLNAAEAVEGDGRIELRISEGPELQVQVIDSGPGIPPEIRSRLTEPFFTTKRIGKNVGLGLSMVDQACRQCGGQLQLESRPGFTCFQISLPAHL